MFGSGLYLININRISLPIYDKEAVFPYDDEKGSLLGEGLFNQYLLTLGDWGRMRFTRISNDYGDDGYWIEAENVLCIIYFIGSTFFTQIVILNMLIAIMSATFDRHNENLQANAMRQKLVLQAEFIKLVNFYQRFLCWCDRSKLSSAKTKMNSSGYLFIMTPTIHLHDDHDSDAKVDPSTSIVLRVV